MVFDLLGQRCPNFHYEGPKMKLIIIIIINQTAKSKCAVKYIHSSFPVYSLIFNAKTQRQIRNEDTFQWLVFVCFYDIWWAKSKVIMVHLWLAGSGLSISVLGSVAVT